MSTRRAFDPIALAVLHHRLAAVAEEMGVLLGRTGFSPNIKERHDYSCALFDARGRLVAQAAHIPVHLGSTPLSVAAALAAHKPERGDVIALNDPFAGGTHLPDVTLVAPVFTTGGALLGFVANRAHHADIGGMTPGSMALAREIYQEGLRIPPIRLIRGGVADRDLMALFLANTRVPAEREGDLAAQCAALQTGVRRLLAVAAEIGRARLARGMAELRDYSARLMAASIRRLPRGVYRAADALDDDGIVSRRVPIRVAITVRDGRIVADFAGTAAQVEGSLNANYAVTLSAVLYVFTALADEPIPANEGVLRCIDVRAPLGTVVNAAFPAAVAGGNVETSQRIVDVVLRALRQAAPVRVPAASCGSMNNIAVGGYDAVRGRPFSYYETIAGGAGGGPNRPGASGVHTHMTNTLNTPIEALEAYYPFRVTQYRLRTASGGRGRRPGGEGLVREIEFLVPCDLTLLTDRRRVRPYGLAGGEAGSVGRDFVRRGETQTLHRLPAKCNLRMGAGEAIRIETPGGGGWGRVRASRRARKRRLVSRVDLERRTRRSPKKLP